METKSKRLYIRLTEKEKRWLQNIANDKGVTISEILRDYNHEKEYTPVLLSVIKELRYLNNNINQATVILHEVSNGRKYPA